MKKETEFTFAGAAHGIIVDDYRLNSTCHCEGAAHGIIVDNYRLNFPCHCEGAAHGIIVDDYRLNFPCHCEECHGHDEAISLRNNDQTKNMSFRGENDNLARRGNPGQICRDKSAGLPRAYSARNDMREKAAFTLAETLITLMVIGVVAALTIPALMQSIGDYTLEKQRTVFEKKFQEGLRQMRVDDKLSEKYATTADFVNEMQKYFKISAVCNKDNLTGCFSTNSFTYHDNLTDLTFNTSDLKTTQNIGTVTGHDLGYNTDVMGIALSDGVQMLIAVNPDCEGISSGDTTGNHTSCFKYIADVNGKKSPSAVGKDIMSNINMSALDFEIASLGPVAPGSAWGPVDNSANGGYSDDYWLGAQAYCEGLTENGGGWKLPTEDQLATIAKIIYEDSGACECEKTQDGWYYCSEGPMDESTCDPTKLNAIPLWQLIRGNDMMNFWSSHSNGDTNAYGRCFDAWGSTYTTWLRSNTPLSALCVR